MNYKSIEELKRGIVDRLPSLLREWYPEGKVDGNHFRIGDISGSKGKNGGGSLSVDLETGGWRDHATDESGDIIILYEKKEGLSRKEAIEKLDEICSGVPKLPKKAPRPKKELIPATDRDYQEQDFALGGRLPSLIHEYRTASGSLYNVVCRYETPDGKTYRPWSWCDIAKGWRQGQLNGPTPIYGMEKLSANPMARIVLCEGEKSADSLNSILAGTGIVAVSAAGGAQQAKNADWSVMQDRRVLIWPDNDTPGRKMADEVAGIMSSYAESVKILDIPKGSMPKGFDASDAVDGLGWGLRDFEKAVKGYAVQFVMSEEEQSLVSLSEDAEDKIIDVVGKDLDKAKTTNALQTIREAGFEITDRGRILYDKCSIVGFLRNNEEIGKHFWKDDFFGYILTSFQNPKARTALPSPRALDDDTLNIIHLSMQEKFKLYGFTQDHLREGIEGYTESKDHKHDLLDYIESKPWDGSDRLTNFFPKVLNTEDSPYIDGVSRYFWMGLMDRAYNPGGFVKSMLVLDGPQNARKSAFLLALGLEKWYIGINSATGSKDFMMSLRGKLVGEIGELASFQKTHHNIVKNTLSATIDEYRPPYGRGMVSQPRTVVLVGTTNDPKYLNDPTGSARYFPVNCELIDVDYVIKHHQQLFAEAAHRYKSTSIREWRDTTPSGAEAAREKKYDRDFWHSEIEKLCRDKNWVTYKDICSSLELPIGVFDVKKSNRIKRVMLKLGWSEQEVTDNSGSSFMAWAPLK